MAEPTIQDVKAAAERVGERVGELRSEMDKINKEVESLKQADPLDQQKIDRIAASVAEHQKTKDAIDQAVQAQNQKIDELETAMQRAASASGEDEAKLAEIAAVHYTNAKSAQGRTNEAVTRDQADVKAYQAYLGALEKMIRYGREALEPEHQKALAEGRDPAGGYLLSPTVDNAILEKARETSPLRQLVRVRRGGSPTFRQLVKRGRVGASRVSETQRRQQTSTPQYGSLEITAWDLHAEPAITTDMLEDASSDIIDDLQNDAAEEFVFTEGYEILHGSGVQEARGLLQMPTAELAQAGQRADGLDVAHFRRTGDANGLGDPARLVELLYSVKSAYQSGASWLASTGAAVAVMTMKDSQGQFLWRPGLQEGQPSTLLGKPIRLVDDMPNVGAGAIPIAYGNWRRAYTWYERRGVRVLRDDYTNHPFVTFKMSKRSGGDVTNPEAYVLLKVQG